MDIEGIVIFDVVTGIPLFSRMKGKTDPSLFSSFIAAIGHFSKQLKFGGLSSFSTEEKVIYLAPRENIITALIAPKKKEYQEAYALANELGRQFEDERISKDLNQESGDIEFAEIADQYLKRIQNPFISRVSEFILNQYGGEVLIGPRLMRRDGSQGVVDLLMDSRTKKEHGNGTSMFGENYGFVKTSDSRIGRVQVIEFIDSLDNFGVLSMQKDEMVLQPYFPSKAVIVAREFDPPVFDYLRKLPSEKGLKYVDGAYVFAGLKMKGIPKETRCFVELWQWHDDKAPERIDI
ncbi:MAG: hypothetical protein ACXAAO_02700 [Candidatus Thorarchaeota archaeon]|jgi:hypothetical protein